MSLIQRITRALTGDIPEPVELTHVPVSQTNAMRHKHKLKEAALRNGNRPFKCAADGLPREVLKDGRYITVGAQTDEPPAEPPAKPALKAVR